MSAPFGTTIRMKNLPLPARLYVAGVIALGACLFVAFTPWTGLESSQVLLFFSLLLLSVVSSAFQVNLPLFANATMPVSYAIDFASLMLIGRNVAMLTSAVGAWAACSNNPKEQPPTHRILFRMASAIVTMQAAGLTCEWMEARFGTDLGGYALAAAGALFVYFATTQVLAALEAAICLPEPERHAWRRFFASSLPGFALAGVLGSASAFLVERSVQYFAALAAIPLFFTYRAYRIYMARVEEEQQRVHAISNLHLTTIEALALAIDAKDQRSHEHIRRMQVCAAALGKAFGMRNDEVDALRTAALLHDIGKLAIPEHILSKPGPLTPDETKKVRIHPVVGAEIIAQVPFPYPVAPLILSHHERWDGRGYPTGLKGEEIPLGARILAVVDNYDALVSDRPYHTAVSHDGAVQLVVNGSGKAFDPAVVDAFVRMLPDLPGLLAASSSSLLNPSVIEGLTVPSPSDASGEAGGVLEDIAVAHREIYALYEIAQAMGTSLGVIDTMRVISSKLSNLVPFSCFALYLYSRANDTLVCRFATGTDADLMRRVTVKNGHGVTGWVARNRQAVVNARPDLDFEEVDEPMPPTRLHSALACPLVFNGEVIGTLAVYHIDAGFYNDDHRRLLDRVCEQAAAVIANSITFERTQQDSLTDSLTGLPNMRHLLTNLERELARAERLKSEVAFIVMDLDDFKAINDHYGHQAGDRALQKIAAVLKNATRPYDMCVRYAGDEFIIVLPGCTTEEADRKLRDLQTAVESVRFEARPGRMISLGVSAGAAIYPSDGGGYESLLAIADARMYRDKTRRKLLLAKAMPGSTGDAQATGAEDAEADPHRAAFGIL